MNWLKVIPTALKAYNALRKAKKETEGVAIFKKDGKWIVSTKERKEFEEFLKTHGE